jgi:hypothetical protein
MMTKRVISRQQWEPCSLVGVEKLEVWLHSFRAKGQRVERGNYFLRLCGRRFLSRTTDRNVGPPSMEVFLPPYYFYKISNRQAVGEEKSTELRTKGIIK